MLLRFRDCLEEQKRQKKQCNEEHSQAFLMTSEPPFLFALLKFSASPHEMLPPGETQNLTPVS